MPLCVQYCGRRGLNGACFPISGKSLVHSAPTSSGCQSDDMYIASSNSSEWSWPSERGWQSRGLIYCLRRTKRNTKSIVTSVNSSKAKHDRITLYTCTMTAKTIYNVSDAANDTDTVRASEELHGYSRLGAASHDWNSRAVQAPGSALRVVKFVVMVDKQMCRRRKMDSNPTGEI